MKRNVGDRVRTATGQEGEILLIDPRAVACVELDGSADDKTTVYRLDELTRIDEGDKNRKLGHRLTSHFMPDPTK